jgi:hypothetical protein
MNEPEKEKEEFEKERREWMAKASPGFKPATEARPKGHKVKVVYDQLKYDEKRDMSFFGTKLPDSSFPPPQKPDREIIDKNGNVVGDVHMLGKKK